MTDRVSGDIERRLANLIRIGVVEELDTSAARVRVRIGELLTAAIPWLTHRAGADRSWWAPEPGEQVVVLSPSGELAQAVVLPALYRSSAPAPADAATVHRVVYEDGTTIEYDRAAHKLKATVVGDVEVTADGDVTIDAGGNATVNAGNTATVSAGSKVVVSAPQICVGSDSSADPVVRQSDLQAAIDALILRHDTHTHPTAAPGPPSVPTVPIVALAATGSPKVSID